MNGRGCLIVLAILILPACTVGPDYRAPQRNASDQWASLAGEQAASAQIDTAWWTIFADPQLEGYLADAVRQNHQLEMARAGVQRAVALRRETGADFYPSVDTRLSHARARTSGAASNDSSGPSYRSLYTATLAASWEVDLFGGIQRAEQAATARLLGAEEERRAVLMAILAETARGYLEIRGVQKQIAITRKNIAVQEQTYRLVESLFTVGEASEFDLSRARGQLQLTRSRLPDLDAALRTGIYRLAVLLGQPPESLLEEMLENRPLPAPPDRVPVGLRSEILQRRPDVRAAERALAAAVAEIGVATADLYPKFFLTGDLGRSARTLSDLLESASNVASLGQLLQWPVFAGGALQAKIAVREAEARQAAAAYEQTVLASLADVESALIRYLQKLETRRRLGDAVQSRRQAVGLARALFNAGEENFLAVLDAERELIAAEDDLVVSETNTVLHLVTLYTALGGGWELFETEPIAVGEVQSGGE
ncbi:MAG: efflux transporter outer membrane subunit [Desulfuromonadales bacterium]|nr:efflux transporter outer membrane subunit [Desulfuromonadales bacterium]